MADGVVDRYVIFIRPGCLVSGVCAEVEAAISGPIAGDVAGLVVGVVVVAVGTSGLSLCRPVGVGGAVVPLLGCRRAFASFLESIFAT